MSDLDRLIVDHSEQIILLVEPETLRIVIANRAAVSKLGYTHEELLGKTTLDIESALPDVFYWEDARCGQYANIESQEGLYLCADGSLRRAVKSIRLIEDGDRRWLLISARAVEEERQVEDILAQTTSQLRATLESTGNGILVVDWQGRIASMNRLFSAMWRLPDDLLQRQDDAAVVDFLLASIVDQDTMRSRLREIMEDEETEDIVHLRDGRVFQCKSLPQYLGERIIGRVFGFDDISERIRIESDLIAARQKAEMANQAKAAFLAMMSHEIRTPMNGVIGVTGLLFDTPLNDEQKRYLEIIRSSSEALLSIIDDILDFSKIEAQKLTLDAVDFDLAGLLKEIADFSRLRAAQKGLEFVWNLDPQLPSRLRGDPGRLRQILTNLIGNSLKFTAAGRITLRVTRLPDRGERIVVRCEVEDTGIGIASESLGKIFSPFEQADSSTTRRYGGTGLGLAITKQLVELMDGEIAVVSELGVGTTFGLNLVLAPAASSNAESSPATEHVGAAPSALAKEARRSRRLLVVEDNAVNLMVMRSVLTKLGFECLDQALDGNEAIEKAAATNYDLILMDCQMPKLDGYEATRRLRAMGIATPVVAMTAHALSGDREKCLAAGMDDYLTKPIVLERLVAVLDRWLGRASESMARADPVSESGPVDANADFAYDDFLDLLMGDDELADSLLAMFVANTPDDIAKLKQTLVRGDAEQVRAAAHSIKGAAANLCATAVNAAAYAIEQAARRGDLAGAAVLLAKLESAWQKFVNHPRVQRSGATKAV